MSATYTVPDTFSATDVSAVMRRVTAEFVMIAQSTGAITEAKAREWAHDVEALAQGGYLKAVDLTLLTGGAFGTEVLATRYTVDTASGDIATSRPGGVMWPRVHDVYLRIVLSHTGTYDATARARMKSKLKETWSRSDTDISHQQLVAAGGRSFVSSTFGMHRQDFC